MASIDYHGKLKSGNTGGKSLYHVLRHNDKDARQTDGHSNPNINRDMTKRNVNLTGLTLNESAKKYEARRKELDSNLKKAPRKDRTEAFDLVIYPPDGLSKYKETVTQFTDIYNLLKERFGQDNIIAANVHVDEIHAYTDHTGTEQVSKAHMHLTTVCEIDGRICGKEQSSKKRIKETNKAVDEYTREHYGMAQNVKDGNDRKHQTVKELKETSNNIESIKWHEQMAQYHLQRAQEIRKYLKKHGYYNEQGQTNGSDTSRQIDDKTDR